MEQDKCYICNEAKDKSNHIFLSYEFAKNYWNFVERKLEIKFKSKDSWLMGSWLKEREGFDEDSKDMLKSFLAVSFWLLWKNRCQKKYEGKLQGIQSLFLNASRVAIEYNTKGGKGIGSREEKDEENFMKDNGESLMSTGGYCFLMRHGKMIQ
ncbi:hypothetical protein Cni_G28518 [Canna indica]|uniref:Reverse transcriptase zinc-binding domain-containing protein n=1 Tax=Canna indica TaxID=4628 RepID=A0AAQ3QNV1_9LILI|nr:hypothetical protein Cni_G28518 [Canna indica]